MTEKTDTSYILATLVAVLSVFSVTRAYCVDIESPSSIPVTWSSKQYEANLPPPHGITTITLYFDGDGELSNIAIKSDVTSTCMRGKMIEGLTDLSEPDISIPSDDTGVLSDHFTASFEYGPKYQIKISNCEKTGLNCVDWVQDIVDFEVDSTGKVLRKVHDIGGRLGHRSD